MLRTDDIHVHARSVPMHRQRVQRRQRDRPCPYPCAATEQGSNSNRHYVHSDGGAKRITDERTYAGSGTRLPAQRHTE